MSFSARFAASANYATTPLTVGSVYARRLKRRQGRLGDIWHLDEVFVTIQGQRRYLWRAVDQDGDVIDILVQSRRDCRAATLFFRKLLKGQERTPGRWYCQVEQNPPVLRKDSAGSETENQ